MKFKKLKMGYFPRKQSTFSSKGGKIEQEEKIDVYDRRRWFGWMPILEVSAA